MEMDNRTAAQLDTTFNNREKAEKFALLVGDILKIYGSRLTPFGRAKIFSSWLDEQIFSEEQILTEFQAYCIAGELHMIAWGDCDNPRAASAMANSAATYYDKALGLLGKVPQKYKDLEGELLEKGSKAFNRASGVMMLLGH